MFELPPGGGINPSRIPRAAFAAATIVTAALGFILEFSGIEGSARLFVASGAFGLIWWAWDLIVDYVTTPLGRWAQSMMEGGSLKYTPPRYGVDDTIRVLEQRLARGGGRKQEIQTAMRLADIYRGVKRDEIKARAVISRVREKYPEALELSTYWESLGGAEEDV